MGLTIKTDKLNTAQVRRLEALGYVVTVILTNKGTN